MDKIKFRCTACQYKFSRFNKPQVCPFCGRAAVVEDLETSAEEFLKEVEQAR